MANPKSWQDNSDDWTTDADWSGGTRPGATDDVTVAQGDPQINSDVGTIASLTNSASVDVNTGGDLDVTGALTNSGNFRVDTAFGAGGSTVTVGGTLTNSGYVQIGTSVQNPSALVTVNVGGLTNFSSTNVLGTLYLYGGPSTLTALNVNAAAGFGVAGNLAGTVALYGDSQIKFASGTITTIRGSLQLNGASALITTNGSTNDVFSALTSVTSSGTLDLENGSKISSTAAGGLTNAGAIKVDNNYAAGGSTLGITGTLTNSGSIQIGSSNQNASAPVTVNVGSLANFNSTGTAGTINIYGGPSTLAALNVGAAAGFGVAGAVSGNVALYGDAEVKFTSGTISQIRGSLQLNGPSALITTDGTTNNTLAGLSSITSTGTFDIENSVVVSSTAAGGVTNAGTIRVDTNYAAGGSALDIQGTLTNSGSFQIGASNQNLSAPTTVNVGGLSNSVSGTNGTITLYGTPVNPGTGGSNAATLNVAAAAGFGTTGSLVGSVNLYQTAKVEFTGGQINTIATGGSLLLYGPGAAISNDGSDTNSALTGLSSVNGTLELENGAAVSSATGISNTGTINVDTNYAAGGSTFDVTGTLTNTGTFNFGPGNENLSAPTTVNVGGLTNAVGGTSGTINIYGSTVNAQSGSSNEALLNVNAAAGFGTAGSLVGNVNLHEDAVIQFTGGQITTIASGSELTLDGANAAISNDGTDTNSALTGLDEIDGTVNLQNGAALTTGSATGAANTLTVGNTVNVNSGRINATNIDVESGGSLILTNGTANGNVTVASGGTFAGTGSAGAVTVASGGTFNPGADPGIISTGSITLSSGATFGIELGGTASGQYDQDSVTGTVSLGGATFTGSVVNGFAPKIGDTFTIINNDGSDAVTGTFAGLAQGATTAFGGNAFTINYAGGDGNDVVLTDTGPVCFASGTLIRTTRGDVAIEDLPVGCAAVTASGAVRRIKWIGRRRFDCATHPDPAMVLPIRVQAGAFGSGKPYRDLTLSPHHGIAVTCLDEVLIPIRLLVNDSTITQIDAGEITYWHVELDSHDILVANGLPAESYIDVGNRCEFEGQETLVLHPLFKSRARDHALAAYCRPLVTGGAVLSAVRSQLTALAGVEPAAAAQTTSFHLLVDGTPIAPLVKDHQAAFVVPAGAKDVRFVSPTWSPSDIDPASPDGRRLGLMIQGLAIDDLLGTVTDVPLDHPGLVAGLHPIEFSATGRWRWTDGDALLSAELWAHCPGAFVLRLTGTFDLTDAQRSQAAKAA